MKRTLRQRLLLAENALRAAKAFIPPNTVTHKMVRRGIVAVKSARFELIHA